MRFFYATSSQQTGGKQYVDDWSTRKYVCITGFRTVESMVQQPLMLDPATYYTRQYLNFYPLPDSSVLLLLGEEEIK